MDTSKTKTENTEYTSPDQRDELSTKSMGPVMRSRDDDLGVWECVLRFKTVLLIAMAAAFSASLDGYRESFL